MRFVTVAAPGGGTAATVRGGDGLHALLDDGGRRLADLRAVLDTGAGWRDLAREDKPLPEGVRVVRPVIAPAATVCVGVNYRAHIREMGREAPTAPTLFLKLPQALLDPSADVELPGASSQVDYEGELVAVIGLGGRRISREDALAHVAGVTLMNDVTMRDFQYRSLQWFAGKSWRASTPVGPEVVTLDELDDLAARELTTAVNGEVRQRATIGDLVFDIPSLIADISEIVELAPGDLIATGTPGGVGHAMDPPTYLQPGDVVEVALDGLEPLRTSFRTSA